MARRSFLSRLGAGATVVGATMVAGGSTGEAQSGSVASWQPGRYTQDDWLDQIPGRHRLVFDTTTTRGLASAMLYVNNYFRGNQTGYGLKDSDLAVVIVVRHNSTAFAYNDAIWTKYASTLARIVEYTDADGKPSPTANPYLSGEGVALGALAKRGVHLAVCQLATRRFAGVIANGGDVDAVYSELVSNLVPNSHMVPAGIVAVSRAQERGYTFANAG